MVLFTSDVQDMLCETNLQAPFLGQLVQKPAIPGGWWTGMAALLALYCIYEQICFAASRFVVPDLSGQKSVLLVVKHCTESAALSTGIAQATNLSVALNMPFL